MGVPSSNANNPRSYDVVLSPALTLTSVPLGHLAASVVNMLTLLSRTSRLGHCQSTVRT